MEFENNENERNEEEFICACCGERIESNMEKFFSADDDDYICESCYENNYCTCVDCGNIIHIDNSVYLNDECYCLDCADEISGICSECGERVLNEDLREYRGEDICIGCIEDNCDFTYCADCGELLNVNNEGLYIDNRDDYVCDDCADNYRICGGCDTVHHVDNMFYDNGEDCWLCEDCHAENSSYAYSLKEYSFKPNLKVFSTGNEKEKDLYIGFENETECGNSDTSRSEFCDIVGHSVNTDDNVFCYFKKDGSLNNGVEIVSHAFTLEYMQQNRDKFKKLLDSAISCGYKSHDTSTCGLHIHINKEYFGKTTEEIDKNIDKLLLFFEYFREEIRLFSRRSNYHYCKFLSDAVQLSTEKERCNIDNIKKYKSGTSRYVAVNLQNSTTVEIRVFKGTLKYDTFMATLEFVFNLCRLIKHNEISKISWAKLFAFEDTIFLKEYCKNRNIQTTRNILKDYSLEYLKERRKAEREFKQLEKELMKNIKLFKKNVSLLSLTHKKYIEQNIKDKNVHADIQHLWATNSCIKYAYDCLNIKNTISDLTEYRDLIYNMIDNLENLKSSIYYLSNDFTDKSSFADYIEKTINKLKTISKKVK